MLREYTKQTACICIREGDMVQYEDGRQGIIHKIQLVPNGVRAPQLIARLTVKGSWGTLIATANHFVPVPGEKYLDM